MTMRTFSRRLLLATAVLPLHRAFAADLAVTPAQTEGPFYPVAFPIDSDNDLVRVRGQATQAMGTILHLQGRVLDAPGQPLSDATVEIWQCDAQGLYDHPGQPGRKRRDIAFQGYGKVLTDAQSTYSFRTLKPVAYPGRTPHIHLKVTTADGRRLTTQFYVAGDPLNERDFVYRGVAHDAKSRERIEMRLEPADGLEAGAFATTMDIVIA
ncbi:MAG: intradiol ring-cleavage dioxygenase [Reyranellales bacterium]|jgi:protocatechuate 3,4-dioxygenase beta subunit